MTLKEAAQEFYDGWNNGEKEYFMKFAHNTQRGFAQDAFIQACLVKPANFVKYLCFLEEIHDELIRLCEDEGY